MKSPASELRPNELMSLARVQQYTSLSRSSIYRGIARGTFPRQVRLSAGRVGWLRSEVEDWAAECCRARQLNQTAAIHSAFQDANIRR